MSKLLKCSIFYFFLVCFYNLAYSQDVKGNQQPLAQILANLETRYNVKFSYEDKTIEGITMPPLYPELSLKQALFQLNAATNLNFEILSERFISITPKQLNEKIINTVQLLDEIVIKNYLTKGITKTRNSSVKVDVNTFDILPGLIEPDVLQIVQNLPGVISADERISNINVRGGTNDQNLMLFEGIRMYQSGHFFGLISAFNPYLSEEIYVSKNGTSAKFGDGVSSIINIKNYDSVNNKFKAGIGVNWLNVDGFAKLPLSKKTELQLSLRRSLTDAFNSPTYKSYFERIFRDSELNTSNTNLLQSEKERFFFYDANIKFLYDISPKSKLRFNYVTIFNSLDYDQSFINLNTNLQDQQSNLDQISHGTSMQYSRALPNNINASIQGYFSKYELDAKNNDITNSQILIQENKVEDYGFRLDISKKIDSTQNVTFGYQFNEVGVSNLEDASNPVFTSFSKKIIRTHSVFGEVEWATKSKQTYLRLGARANYFEKFADFLMEPRVTFNQKILNHLRLEVLGEIKSQSLTQIIDLQQDFFGIEKRRWQLANNEDIPIVKSQQASIGLNYNKNGIILTLEGYYKNVNNISSRSQGFQNQFQFISDVGSYNINGIDVLFNKRFKNLSTWLSYSYSKNDYQFENLNNTDSFLNTIDLKHVVKASFTYNLQNLKVGIGANWHTGRPYTEPAAIQNNGNSIIEYNSPNSSRLDNYLRTDISATYNFNLSNKVKAKAGISIWNLFNQNNIINRYYILAPDNSILQIDNKSLKFTPNFSFRVNF